MLILKFLKRIKRCFDSFTTFIFGKLKYHNDQTKRGFEVDTAKILNFCKVSQGDETKSGFFCFIIILYYSL